MQNVAWKLPDSLHIPVVAPEEKRHTSIFYTQKEELKGIMGMF